MGSQFSFVYDIVIVAVLVMAVFGSARKGFVSTVVGLAAGLLGFICAITFSAPLSELAYSSFVEEPLSQAVDSALDDSMGGITLGSLSGMDYDEIRVSGTRAAEIVPEYSGTDKAAFDLSSVDLTHTGFDASGLTMFGFDGTEDISALNGKSAEFTRSEINNYGIGRLVMAQVISVKLLDTSYFGQISDYVGQIGQTIPAIFGGTADDISGGDVSAVRSLVLTMLSTSSSVKGAVMEHMIRPVFTVAVQTVLFVLIFVIVSLVVAVVANVLKIVNKIPVIGGLNMFLGGCAGLVSGLLSIFVICIVVRLLVSLTDGSVMLLNETAIGETAIFGYFYNMDILNFLT